jgi:hypothetical protein
VRAQLQPFELSLGSAAWSLLEYREAFIDLSLFNVMSLFNAKSAAVKSAFIELY